MKPPNPEETLPDYARRAADIVNSYFAFVKWDELMTKWVAIRLSDGGSDGTLYDSMRDAKSHQSHPNLCAYVSFKNCAGGVNAHEMMRHIDFTRQAYDAGMRLPDPEDIRRDRELPNLMIPFAQYDWWRKAHG